MSAARLIALTVVLGGVVLQSEAAPAQGALTVTEAQVTDLSGQCKKQIDAVNAEAANMGLNDAPTTLRSPGMLHDVAYTTDPAVISQAKLDELNGALKQASAAGESPGMIKLFEAVACVMRGRLTMAGAPAKAGKPGKFDPYTATEYDFQKRAAIKEFKRGGEYLHQAKATAGMSTGSYSCSSAKSADAYFSSTIDKIQALDKVPGFVQADVPELNRMGVDAASKRNAAKQIAEFSCNRTDDQ
jgi:hypothetical protein